MRRNYELRITNYGLCGTASLRSLIPVLRSVFRSPLRRGFTLIEISLVMAIIGILYMVVLPLYPGSMDRAKEATLKEDLHVMRKCLDDYYRLNGKWPVTLETLVSERFIRKLPVDPVTGLVDWQITRDEESGGVRDIHSRSKKPSRDGTLYSSW